MSLKASTRWDSEEDPEIRRYLVRPKSAKGRNRPTSVQLQGRLQPRTIGCELLTQKSTEETLEQGTSTQNKEDTAQHRTHSQNVWKSKTIDRDMRLGSGRTQSAHANTNAHMTGTYSTLQAKDMNFPLPAKVNAKDMNFPLPAKVNAKDMNFPLPAKVNAKDMNFPLTAKVNAKDMNFPLPAKVNAKDMNFPLPAKVNAKDMNFPLPAKVPCTLNKYSILPSIGCVGERPSRLQPGLCSEDSGA